MSYNWEQRRDQPILRQAVADAVKAVQVHEDAVEKCREDIKRSKEIMIGCEADLKDAKHELFILNGVAPSPLKEEDGKS